ncbi:unnamed protein product [Lampetra fluviatilis]
MMGAGEERWEKVGGSSSGSLAESGGETGSRGAPGTERRRDDPCSHLRPISAPAQLPSAPGPRGAREPDPQRGIGPTHAAVSRPLLPLRTKLKKDHNNNNDDDYDDDDEDADSSVFTPATSKAPFGQWRCRGKATGQPARVPRSSC